MPKFSARLSNFIDEHRLTQAQAGKLLGVTGKYIGMLVRGEKTADDDSTLSRLLRLYEANGLPDKFQPDDGEPSVMQEEAFAYGRAALKKARLDQGKSLQDLCRETGLRVGYLRDLEEGRVGASEKTISKLALSLGVDKEILMAGSDEPVSRDPFHGTFGATPNVSTAPGIGKAKYVPLISYAQAGAMQSFTDEIYTGEGWLVFDPKDPKAIAITIRGDSMAPQHQEGDVALIYPSYRPRNGGLVVARLKDEYGGDVMFKLYASKDGGKTAMLTSYNPAHPPLQYDVDQIAWIAPVASMTTQYEI